MRFQPVRRRRQRALLPLAVASAAVSLGLASSAAAQPQPSYPPYSPYPPYASSAGVEPVRDLPPWYAQRLEVQVDGAYSFTPSSISHVGAGATMARYLTDYLATGMSARYWPSARPPAPSAALWPLQKKTWSADLDFTYVPFSSARRAGGRPVVPMDGYLVAGVGAIATAPVPVIDATRTFDPTIKVDGVVGAGGRLFITSFLALSVEVRDYIYSDRLENPTIGPSPHDPASWYGPNRLVNDVQAGLGLGLWLPIL